MVKISRFNKTLLEKGFKYEDGTPLEKVFEIANRISFILDDDITIAPVVYNTRTAKPVIRISIPYGPQDYDEYSIEFHPIVNTYYFDNIDKIRSDAKAFAKIGKAMTFLPSLEVYSKDILGK